MEQTITVTEKVVGDKTYKTLVLKDLEPNNSVIIEKTFAEGMQFKSKFQPMKTSADGTAVVDTTKPPVYTYSCGVKYKDDLCSLWLNEKQHKEYKVCGGIGDSIMITKFLEKNKRTGAYYGKLKFDKVE